VIKTCTVNRPQIQEIAGREAPVVWVVPAEDGKPVYRVYGTGMDA
jgi:hypothetical protein